MPTGLSKSCNFVILVGKRFWYLLEFTLIIFLYLIFVAMTYPPKNQVNFPY